MDIHIDARPMNDGAVASHAASAASDTQARCERALELMLTSRGDPAVEIDRVLARDPNCAVAHCLRVALVLRADSDAARPALAASIAAIEACAERDDPARRHAAAAHAWLDGDQLLALERYGAILIDHPRDSIALAVAHALDFRLGRRNMLRDRVARVLPHWHAALPGYASVLAMYAFGLEENGRYRRAEKMARRALALDARHPGAIHVVAHVMEMQGRDRDGLAFLAATEAAWAEDTGFSVHLAWHRALFHLGTGDPSAALAVYDTQIAKPGTADMPALADASALLWRLRLRDMPVGARWRLLADAWEMQNLAGARPFYAVHATMAFAAAGRSAAASRVLEELPPVDDVAAVPPSPEAALASPLCRALLAYAGRDYAACVDWLARVRHIAHRCGGSVAQCDIVRLTFAEAASRARQARRARALPAPAAHDVTAIHDLLADSRLRVGRV